MLPPFTVRIEYMMGKFYMPVRNTVWRNETNTTYIKVKRALLRPTAAYKYGVHFSSVAWNIGKGNVSKLEEIVKRYSIRISA